MKRSLVFVSSKTDPARLRNLCMQNQGQYRLVLVDDQDTARFGELRVESLSDYRQRAKSESYYPEIAMEWMDAWNRRVQFDKQIMYEGFSLWWFERFGFQLWLLRTFADIDAVRELIGEVEPEEVLLVEIDDYWQGVIGCVATHLNLATFSVERKEATDRFAGHKRFLNEKFPLLALTLFRAIRSVSALAQLRSAKGLPILTLKQLRAIQGMFRRLRGRLEARGEKRAKVLMFTLSMDWQKSGGVGHRPRYVDAQLGEVLRRLLGRGTKVIALDVMAGHYKAGFRTLFQKRYPYVPLEGYDRPHLCKSSSEVKQTAQDFDGIWDKLSQDPGFRQCNTFNGVDMSELLEKRLRPFIVDSVPAWIRSIKLYTCVLDRERPDVVVVSDEYSSGRPLATAARIVGIPAVAIQHGIIHENHTGYVYPKDADIETIPLPDKTAVFGDHYREILTKHSVYEDSAVEVTGQPRLDALTREDITKLVEPSTLPELPAGKKILLFTSQQGIEQLAAPVLLEGLSQLGNDYFLIIKLHPGESYPAVSYNEAAERYGVSNLAVLQQVDLYELLALCDLHISVGSTVLSEAVVFGKPNLVLNVRHPRDGQYWLGQGVAMSLRDFSSLREAVETILGDEEVKQRLEKAREDYIERHFYRLDGKSAERVCDLVLSLVPMGKTGLHLEL